MSFKIMLKSFHIGLIRPEHISQMVLAKFTWCFFFFFFTLARSCEGYKKINRHIQEVTNICKVCPVFGNVTVVSHFLHLMAIMVFHGSSYPSSDQYHSTVRSRVCFLISLRPQLPYWLVNFEHSYMLSHILITF